MYFHLIIDKGHQVQIDCVPFLGKRVGNGISDTGKSEATVLKLIVYSFSGKRVGKCKSSDLMR